jgi:hypothetical protein
MGCYNSALLSILFLSFNETDPVLERVWVRQKRKREFNFYCNKKNTQSEPNPRL